MTDEIRWYGKALAPALTEVLMIVLSDWHYGNPYCSLSHIKRAIQFILGTPNCYVFLNGDLCEAAIRTSKGEIFRQVGSPRDQRDWVIETLTPIKDRILGATDGNHEARISDPTGMDISADIADAMGVPYCPDGLTFKLSFGSGNSGHPDKRYVFKSYVTHGYGGARTKAAKAVKVERTATWLHADWYAMSHDHVVNAAPDVYLMDDARSKPSSIEGFVDGKMTEHRKMLVKTGAFLKWGGYSQRLGFPPTDLAMPLIWLLTPQSPMWQNIPEKPTKAVKVMV